MKMLFGWFHRRKKESTPGYRFDGCNCLKFGGHWETCPAFYIRLDPRLDLETARLLAATYSNGQRAKTNKKDEGEIQVRAKTNKKD
jgi:hypothetical protein